MKTYSHTLFVTYKLKIMLAAAFSNYLDFDGIKHEAEVDEETLEVLITLDWAEEAEADLLLGLAALDIAALEL